MITINNYQVYFSDKLLLKVDNLFFPKTGLISICGEIGCGKSTFVKSLINYTSFRGQIKFKDDNIKEIEVNKKISYIPQNLDYYFLTNTLREEVFLITTKSIDFFVDLMKKFNIYHLIDSDIDSISGGEQIRCALFLNEICKVECLILDETLAMNDYKNLSMLSEEVNHISKEKLVIEISHNLERICKADIIFFIWDKKIYTFEDFDTFKNNKFVNKVWRF